MFSLVDAIEALTNSRSPHAETVISEAVIDSRQVVNNSMFVALPGEHKDGHDYVVEAFQEGASYALIKHDIEGPFRKLSLVQGQAIDPQTDLSSPLCLIVEDPLVALQKIAHFWRRKLNLRVIGITGSVGKSTTKEVVADVLAQRYLTFRSPGNLNNEIGLPLAILQLDHRYKRAVLEMGFYVPGEIALLCDIALPEIGVITNIGTVHAERAGSQAEIFRGKSELVKALPTSGVAVLNLDDPLVRKMAKFTQAKVFYYGLDSAADLWANNVEGLGLDGIRFCLHYRYEALTMSIPMIGKHSVHTALRAAAVGLVDGLTWQEILDGLRQKHSQLRLTVVRSKSGAQLIDDTYNASPDSMQAALNLLGDLHGNKVAVLGDMLELGQYEEQGHEMVGRRVAEVADILITVGKRGHIIASAARHAGMKPGKIFEFDNHDDAITHLQKSLSKEDVVLVKGSRNVHMDQIVNALEIPE